MEDKDLWTPEQAAVIAEHWRKWQDAAEAGDEQARDFLETFGPWAERQLAMRLKS